MNQEIIAAFLVKYPEHTNSVQDLLTQLRKKKSFATELPYESDMERFDDEYDHDEEIEEFGTSFDKISITEYLGYNSSYCGSNHDNHVHEGAYVIDLFAQLFRDLGYLVLSCW